MLIILGNHHFGHKLKKSWKLTMHCGSSRLVSENFHHLIILHLLASPQSLAFDCLYQAVLMTETEQEILLYTCSGPHC